MVGIAEETGPFGTQFHQPHHDPRGVIAPATPRFTQRGTPLAQRPVALGQHRLSGRVTSASSHCPSRPRAVARIGGSTELRRRQTLELGGAVVTYRSIGARLTQLLAKLRHQRRDPAL